MNSFALPDLGEGLQDAEIVSWHVAEGDHVVTDEPLVSVETDKAVVEIPSPHAGRVAHLFGKVGDRVKVGAPLVEFEEGPHADTGTVMGELPTAPAGPKTTPIVPPSPRPLQSPTAAAAPRIEASPAVRALARERGVDLALVHGSGPSGAITRADVEAARTATAAIAGAEPLRGVRRSMAINMAAGAEIVRATIWDEVAIESWWRIDADVTGRLIAAIAVACRAVPVLNSWFDGKALALRSLPNVDLGIAVDTADGLIVPVLRGVEKKDAAAIRRELDGLKAAVRARTVPRADLKDPTITLSNFGVLGGRQAALAIVPPQVAIIGAGRISQQAVPSRNGSVAFVHILPLSLTFDHRVVTGGDAARFLKAMIEALAPAA